MKTPILLLIVTLVSRVCAQTEIPTDTSTGKISFTEIVYADSFTKKQLFNKTLEWVALYFPSAVEAIQLKDPEAGKIIIKDFYAEPLDAMGDHINVNVYYTLFINFKDGRCRVRMIDFDVRYWAANTQVDRPLEQVAKIVSKPSAKETTKLLTIKPSYWEEANDWANTLQLTVASIHTTLDSFSAFIQNPTLDKNDW